MNAKDYLKQLERLEVVINQKKDELKKLEEQSISIGSVDYSKPRVQTSLSGEAHFAKIVDKRVDLNKEIQNKIDEYNFIVNQIHQLDNPKHIQILYKRYVELKRFEWICAEMNYSWQHILRLHGYALKAFQEKFINEIK